MRQVKGGARAKMLWRAGIGRKGRDGDVATPCGRRSPWWHGSGAKGSFPLGGFPMRAHTCAAARRPGRPDGAAVPLGSRAGAVGAHTLARRRKRFVGKRIRESDRWGRLVIETEEKDEDSGRWAAVRWCWVGPAARFVGLAG
jgi:hypothetical protein